MQYITSNQNVSIPCMLYGTAWKKERTAELVALALESGFRGIDTACQPKHYEEALVGDALSRLCTQGLKREELFVQTKFTPLNGQDPSCVPYDPRDPIETQIKTSFEVSKANLQTSYIDSLLLHSPLFPYAQLLKAWQAMESLHHSGEVKQLGISNCYDLALLQQLWEDAHIKPSVVQNRFYSDTEYDKALRVWCHSNGVIYQSFWTLSANPHILHSPTMQSIANTYGQTAEQILYRYVIHKGMIPLNGTTSALHMKEDLAIFEFVLDEESIKIIDLLLT